MAADLQIRLARESDVDAIHRLEVDAFPAPWRREFFDSELRASGRLSLVAIRNRGLIAYAFTMWIFDEMHVNKIAVAVPERRKGVADALMEACFDFARKNGITTISLEVRESNREARDFYEHLDFEGSYIRPRYYPDGEAAVVMTRRL